jgi:hypothetical protein
MVLDMKFIFCEYNTLWENHEFKEVIVFMLRIIRKTSKTNAPKFYPKKKIMSTIKEYIDAIQIDNR